MHAAVTEFSKNVFLLKAIFSFKLEEDHARCCNRVLPDGSDMEISQSI